MRKYSDEVKLAAVRDYAIPPLLIEAKVESMLRPDAAEWV